MPAKRRNGKANETEVADRVDGEGEGMLLNMRVLKKFPYSRKGRSITNALFLGTVVDFQPCGAVKAAKRRRGEQMLGRGLYRVHFDDGDVDDMDPEEAFRCCVLYHEQRQLRRQRKAKKNDTPVIGSTKGRKKIEARGLESLLSKENRPLTRVELEKLDEERMDYWLEYRQFNLDNKIPKPKSLAKDPKHCWWHIKALRTEATSVIGDSIGTEAVKEIRKVERDPDSETHAHKTKGETNGADAKKVPMHPLHASRSKDQKKDKSGGSADSNANEIETGPNDGKKVQKTGGGQAHSGAISKLRAQGTKGGAKEHNAKKVTMRPLEASRSNGIEDITSKSEGGTQSPAAKGSGNVATSSEPVEQHQQVGVRQADRATKARSSDREKTPSLSHKKVIAEAKRLECAEERHPTSQPPEDKETRECQQDSKNPVIIKEPYRKRDTEVADSGGKKTAAGPEKCKKGLHGIPSNVHQSNSSGDNRVEPLANRERRKAVSTSKKDGSDQQKPKDSEVKKLVAPVNGSCGAETPGEGNEALKRNIPPGVETLTGSDKQQDMNGTANIATSKDASEPGGKEDVAKEKAGTQHKEIAGPGKTKSKKKEEGDPNVGGSESKDTSLGGDEQKEDVVGSKTTGTALDKSAETIPPRNGGDRDNGTAAIIPVDTHDPNKDNPRPSEVVHFGRPHRDVVEGSGVYSRRTLLFLGAHRADISPVNGSSSEGCDSILLYKESDMRLRRMDDLGMFKYKCSRRNGGGPVYSSYLKNTPIRVFRKIENLPPHQDDFRYCGLYSTIAMFDEEGSPRTDFPTGSDVLYEFLLKRCPSAATPESSALTNTVSVEEAWHAFARGAEGVEDESVRFSYEPNKPMSHVDVPDIPNEKGLNVVDERDEHQSRGTSPSIGEKPRSSNSAIPLESPDSLKRRRQRWQSAAVTTEEE